MGRAGGQQTTLVCNVKASENQPILPASLLYYGILKRSMNERREAFIRIPICIVSGIVLSLWQVIVKILIVLQWIMVIFSGKRNKDLANFCQMFNTQWYYFFRYLTFHSNHRPFPFTELKKDFDKFDK